MHSNIARIQNISILAHLGRTFDGHFAAYFLSLCVLFEVEIGSIFDLKNKFSYIKYFQTIA